MSDDPIIAPILHVTAVEQTDAGAELPVPSPEQEQVADDLFTREQGQVVAALLGVQTGLAIAHHLMVEAVQANKPEEEPRRRPRLEEPPAR